MTKMPSSRLILELMFGSEILPVPEILSSNCSSSASPSSEIELSFDFLERFASDTFMCFARDRGANFHLRNLPGVNDLVGDGDTLSGNGLVDTPCG
ncbi:hypothetical protein COP2_004988 [Malus domestica]